MDEDPSPGAWTRRATHADSPGLQSPILDATGPSTRRALAVEELQALVERSMADYGAEIELSLWPHVQPAVEPASRAKSLPASTAESFVTAAVDAFLSRARESRTGRTNVEVADEIRAAIVRSRVGYQTGVRASFPLGDGGFVPQMPTFTDTWPCSDRGIELVRELNDMVLDLDRLAAMEHTVATTGRPYPLDLLLYSSRFVSYEVQCLGNCNEGFASYDQNQPGVIRLWEPFFEILSLAPRAVRASVLAHELVHLVDTEIYCRTDECLNELWTQDFWGAEFRAALVQYDWLGLPTCMSDALAAAYANSASGRTTRLESYWIALVDLLDDCLGLPRWAAQIAAAAIVALALSTGLGLIAAIGITAVVDAVLAFGILGLAWDCPV